MQTPSWSLHATMFDTLSFDWSINWWVNHSFKRVENLYTPAHWLTRQQIKQYKIVLKGWWVNQHQNSPKMSIKWYGTRQTYSTLIISNKFFFTTIIAEHVCTTLWSSNNLVHSSPQNIFQDVDFFLLIFAWLRKNSKE